MEDNPDPTMYTLKLDKSTEGDTDIYNITWTIPMFGQLLKTKPILNRYDTTRRTVVEVPDTPFQLKMDFFGISKSELIVVHHLVYTSSYVKWSVEYKRGGTSRTFSKDNYMTLQANRWEFCFSMSYGDKNNILETEPLHLFFKFTVSHAVCRNIPLPYIQLSEAFGTLLTDTVYSDVTMKSAEGIEFRAHKAVLAVRSEVLRAHFEHNMRESITNVVETPWETEVLRDVLTFMYTDKAPRVDDAPDKLLAAADYYQLDRLKSLCEEALNNRLTVENAVDTLRLAELYSLSSLRLSTLNYIKNYRLKLVKETQGWKNIKSVEFIQRIYDFIFADQINKIDILANF
ncbi:Roadkill [Operophtera brumata]|uniref:Roadkill n=1 Tax=Operophtera brumata TaxID=104452 RepID=A0A0L7KZA4_OPEBR|nr:Roadkill [Operophtera brumata]